jgi:subtilisin family serine protease
VRPTVFFGLAFALAASSAEAQPKRAPDGATLVRLLGPRAADALAPRGAPGIGALVRMPRGVRASDWGLEETAPGIGRLWGPAGSIVAFGDAHPTARIEVSPPLRTLLNTASTYVNASAAIQQGLDGTGVLVGIADTGLDVSRPDFRDAQGHTRVAWLLDLSVPPIGLHPELEQKFGSTDSSNRVVAGAVWSSQDIDGVLGTALTLTPPQDEEGHGTLVTSCAAGNGSGGTSPYRGVAPNATILFARITDPGGASIGNDELLRGVAFLFDRASALQRPIVVNLSIGTDFGPHDGTTDWEKTLASYVGPSQPGRALVVAAGNSGSIADTPVHQNAYVPGGSMRIPLVTGGAQNGSVQVWVAMHARGTLSVGLDGPDGTWVSPVSSGNSAGKSTNDYNAGIFNGSQPMNSPVPTESRGAVIVWQGKWPAGTYNVTLEGTGSAELYLQATGDASTNGISQTGFLHGVREGTISLPATHPALIAVGCTINKASWRDLRHARVGLVVPLLDMAGGELDPNGDGTEPVTGEPCWFSGAGPTLTGVYKPEIMAPGAAIVGTLSQQAVPPDSSSIFTNPDCPLTDAGPDPSCQEIDTMHGVSFGTSFSSPIVAGAVAVMMQHDPTLTQDRVVAALQAGAHRLRASAPFADQSGPGEVDVLGAVAAVDRQRAPKLALPSKSASWLALGADQALADGSTPLEAILQLRAASAGSGPAPPADGFSAGRLAAYLAVNGSPPSGAVSTLVRRGPGVWVLTVQLPPGLGGSTLTLGATFDGVDIVTPKTIPIATDAWNADYPPTVKGGCNAAPGSGRWEGLVVAALVVGARSRRRMRTRITGDTTGPCSREGRS